MVSAVRNINTANAARKNTHDLGQSVMQSCMSAVGGRGKYYTIRNPKVLNGLDKIGEKISSSYNQRLILGATALATQPFIDLGNKRVDNETRKVSVCRTIAKILVGTATGFLIRYGCIKGIDAFTKSPKELPANAKFKNVRSILLPTVKYTAEELAQYKNTLGTLMALGVMVFTNFLIDAPLTKLLTNALVKGVDKHER